MSLLPSFSGLPEWRSQIITPVKYLTLFFMTFFLVGCTNAEQRNQNLRANDQKPVTPTPVPFPFDFPKLNDEEVKHLNETFPENLRKILENAERIQVFETQVCHAGHELLPIEKGQFQGCKVLRKATVSDPELKKKLVEGIFYSIGAGKRWRAACFDPQHGIRAEYRGERIELLICFGCYGFRGVTKDAGFGGGYTFASERIFETILTVKLIVTNHNPSGY